MRLRRELLGLSLPLVTFVLPSGARVAADVPAGCTLLEAARRLQVAIEGACGGAMACATCHVHVDPAWEALLPAPRDEEVEMLDFAADLHARSRLACQIRVGAAQDGLTVAVPPSSLLA